MSRRPSQTAPPVSASHQAARAIEQQQQHRALLNKPSAYPAWLDRSKGNQEDPDRHYFSRPLDRLDSESDEDAASDDSDGPHGYGRANVAGDAADGRNWAADDDDGAGLFQGDDDYRPDGPWLIGGQGPQAPYFEQKVQSYDVAKRVQPADDESASESDTYDGDSTASDTSLGPETVERLEWQHMLNNVLQGDVLKSEKTRLSSTLAHQLDDSAGQRKYHAQQIWVGVRAFVRARDVEHERRYLEEARSAIDDIIADVASFRVTTGLSESQSAEEVNMLLRRVQWAISLYPSVNALVADKPAFNEERMIARIDALQSWATITRRLRVQIGILQKWTGSEELEITQPVNEPIVSERIEPGDGPVIQQAADPNKRRTADLLDRSTFIERILKDNSIEKTFRKGTLTDVFPLARVAKYTMIANRDLFGEMGLPPFSDDLVALLKFPVALMDEALRVQLDMGQRAPKDDPSMALIDQLTEDFRSCISIAAQLKQDFIALIATDTESGWSPPNLQGVREHFQHTLEDALKFFFKLLHWKLKSGNKAVYLKETEIVESEWRFLTEATEHMEGADLLVGEHFSMITHRLILRVLSYFNNTLETLLRRKASADDTSRWFNQTLDNVRQRHRKLLRFGMGLIQRFENAAEWHLDDIDLAAFINALAESGHFLCYTGTMEQQGSYIIGNPALHDKPQVVQRILTRTYNTETTAPPAQSAGFGPSVRDMPETAILREQPEAPTVNNEPSYLLVITPREPFIWTGRVMNCAIATFDYEVRERRVRLVADGPLGRLIRAKHLFYSMFPAFRTLVASEGLAHIARVNRELRKIKGAQYRLAQSIVSACDRVQSVARAMEGSDSLLAAYFSFAADLGQRSLRSLEHKFKARLVPLLMKFAIQWVNFICEDCVPSDGRTFKWAVQALEFVRFTTRSDNILQLPPDDFSQLRSGVASCMALLISHFDILGARSSTEAKKEKDKIDAARQEARRTLEAKLADMRAAGIVSPGAPATGGTKTSSLRVVCERLAAEAGTLDEQRKDKEVEMRLVGRVLDQGRPEDRSLLFLASSNSNISIRWQQGRFIGGGTFGQVYLGVNLDTGDLMAVKEIRFQDLSSAPSLIKQVRDEMRVMEMLRHPHIVEYYGIEVHRDKVYIFEEYCQGGSLASLLEHGRIEDETVLQLYTLQLLDGLVYLHSEHVIHRDIKPDNILLDHQGVIKYVDFGAAKVLNQQKRTIQRTLRGEAVNNSLTGTPSYMAPETIKGQVGGHEGAMDVWSLGCVVLECATGKRPWSELDNEWAIMFQIGVAAQHPPLPDQSQLSLLGIDFIRQCLVIDAKERTTAATLRNEHPWILEFVEQLARDYAEEVPDDESSSNSSNSLPLMTPQGTVHLAPSQADAARALHTLGEEEEEEEQ